MIYPVLALERWVGTWPGLRVYLHTVEQREFPHPYPIEMFEIVDAQLPAGWSINIGRIDGQVAVRRISFPEWAHDDMFYERLVDDLDDGVAAAIYQRWLAIVRGTPPFADSSRQG